MQIIRIRIVSGEIQKVCGALSHRDLESRYGSEEFLKFVEDRSKNSDNRSKKSDNRSEELGKSGKI